MSVTPKRGTSRRRHIRLVLQEGIFAELRLIGIGRRRVQTRPGKVVLLDLSPGGLREAVLEFIRSYNSLKWGMKWIRVGFIV
jgi:hypothetical protein